MYRDKFLSFWAGLCAVCLLAVCLLSPIAAQAGDYAVAVVNNRSTTTRLNLRETPSTKGTSLGLYYTGVVVTVLQKTNATWWWVEIGHRKGYMQASYLELCGYQSGYDQAVLDRVGSTMPLAVVNNPPSGGRLNLRGRPSEDWASIGKYSDGTSVEIWAISGDWAYVRVLDDHAIGYMMTKYLRSDSLIASGGAPAQGVFAVVSNALVTDRLNLRASASTKADSLGKYYNGTTVEVLSESNGWCKVKCEGKTGYMQSLYLRKDSDVREAVLPDVARINGDGGRVQPLCSAPYFSAPAVPVKGRQNTETVTVLSKAGTWYYIEMRGARGYYPANLLFFGVRNGMAGNYAVVIGPNLRDRTMVRATASLQGTVLGQYFPGTTVEVLEEGVSGTWSKVRVNGKTGYMHAAYLVPVRAGDPETW